MAFRERLKHLLKTTVEFSAARWRPVQAWLQPRLAQRPFRIGAIATALALILGVGSLGFICSRRAFGNVYRPEQNAPRPPALAADELGVVQGTPNGEIGVGDLKKEIVVVFSDPMVPLARLEAETQGRFTITPQPPGRFRWYGSRVCAYAPSDQLRPGVRYTVRVPAGAKSLNGKSLRRDYSFSFQTPPLNVQYVWPDSSNRIRYDQEFTVAFNYPVSLPAVRNILEIRAGNRRIAYEALYSNEAPEAYGEVPEVEVRDQRRQLTIQLKERLPRDAEVKLTFRKGLVSEREGQGLETDHVVSYQTYGPLQATAIESERFFQDAWESRIQFNNPVDLEKAASRIQFQPRANRLRRYEDNGTELYLKHWNVEPEKEYTITLPADLEDAFGNRLTGERQFNVRFSRIRRNFDASGGVFTIESEMKQRSPVEISGLTEMRSTLQRVTVEDLLRYYGSAQRGLENFAASGDHIERNWPTGVAANRFGRSGLDLAPALSAKRRGLLLANIYQDVENYEGDNDRRNVRQLIQATDLGLVAKLSEKGAHVWLDSLSAGSALAGVRIVAYDGDRRLGECSSDNNGHCRITHTSLPKRPLFVATRGQGENLDQAFVSGRDQAVYMSGIAQNYDLLAARGRLLGQVVFDRRLYRPGEEVFFKAHLALRKDGRLLSDNRSLGRVHVLITDPEGKTVFDKDLAASAQGGVQGGFPTAEGAPLGHYTASFALRDFPDPEAIQQDSDARDLGWNYANTYGRNEVSATFQVEEFRAVAFQVELKGLDDRRIDEAIRFSIGGRYLFGAPMSGAKANYTLYRARRWLSFDQAPRYVFGDGRYLSEELPSEKVFVSSGRGALNAAGIFDVEIPAGALARGDDIGGLPEEVRGLTPIYQATIEARVTDRDDKSVSKQGELTVYPGEFLIGLSRDKFFGEARQALPFRVLTVSHDGKREQTARNLQWMLIRNEWKTIQSRGAGESLQRRNTLVREIVARGSLGTAGGEGALSPTPDKAGSYTLLVRQADGPVYAAADFYALGAGFFAWDFADDDRVQLTAEKTALKAGETARILIQSPFARSRAIVTLEREGIIWQRSIDIEGNGEPIEIPIKAEYAPSVYVGVMLLRPRTPVSEDEAQSQEEDVGRPQIKMGYLRLDVDAEHQRLPLSIEFDRERYAPREKVNVLIRTAPGAEVALAVSDRAVLDLIDYHYADPLQIFYNTWPLGVTILENRRSLIRQLAYANKGSSPGGKGIETAMNQQSGGGFDGDDADGVRRIFKNTAHWAPTLIADARGEIRVAVELPDNLTTFRAMAFAAKGGRFNSAEKEFESRQPIVLQPITPRILRPGDEVEVGALINNDSRINGQFQVTLNAELLEPIDGNRTNLIEAPAGETREASFRVRLNAARYSALREKRLNELRQQSGSAEVGFQTAEISAVIRATPQNVGEFEAAGYAAARVSDAVRIKFPIREEPPVEAFSIAGALDGPATEEGARLPAATELVSGLGELELRLSTTALQGLGAGFEFFRLNPYFCLEQRASAYLLTVTAGDLLKEFRDTSAQARTYDFGNVDQLFMKSLGDFQNRDGGFRAWEWSERSSPYLSAYVAMVLQIAKTRNRSIDVRAYERVMDYLSAYLRDPGRDDRSYILESYGLIAYVLANGGRPNRSLENLLLESENDLSLRGRALLALTLIRSRGLRNPAGDADVLRLLNYTKNRMEITTQKVSFKEESDGYYSRAYYASGSTLAVVLRLFMETDPQHPLIPQMVRHIMDRGGGAPWRDSHSAGWLAFALGEYHERFEKNNEGAYAARILLGGRRLMNASMRGDSLTPNSQRQPLAQLLAASPAGQILPLRIERDANRGRLYYTAILRYLPALARIEARDEGIELRRETIPLSGPEAGEIRAARPLADGAAMQRGNIYLMRLLVTLPKPAYDFALSDPLPANVEAVNTSFGTESQAYGRFVQPSRRGSEWWWENESPRQELRDDRAIFTSPYLAAGIHEFFYLARATVRGRAQAPAARAWLMYEPEVFGRTAAGERTVQ